jgi:hypothetical protein
LLIPTTRITLTELDAAPAPRAPSGLHEVGVLRRRRAAGTTAAGRAGVRRAAAVATRSGAAGQGCTNRGSQVLLAAISGLVIRAGEKPQAVLTRDGCRRENPVIAAAARAYGPKDRGSGASALVVTADARRTRTGPTTMRRVQDRSIWKGLGLDDAHRPR